MDHDTESAIDQVLPTSPLPAAGGVRTCAVIGGNGFIGKHLVRKLLQNTNSLSYRVYVLSRNIPQESDRHPNVAGYIQVDMRDYDGLVRTFANVDTVFHLGAAIPNAFVNSPGTIGEENRRGAVAVVGACKAAGVKNLIFLSGVLSKTAIAQEGQSFAASKRELSRIILDAHGENGLSTCVPTASVIFGPGDKISTTFVTSGMSSFPNLQNELYFMYVEDLTQMLVQLEAKMAAGDNRVLGKSIPLPGERMTFPQFFHLPEWNRSPPHFVHFGMVRFLSYVNTLCAKLFRYAPLGNAICPHILDELNSPVVEDFSPNDMLSVFGLEQIPSVKEGIVKTVSELTRPQGIPFNV